MRVATPSTSTDLPFRISARADYAIRALTEIAAAGSGPVTAQRISQAQAIPRGFLLTILVELRRAGRDLSRPTVEEVSHPGVAGPLRDVWLAVRSALSDVLGAVTLADVATGTLPSAIQVLAGPPEPTQAANSQRLRAAPAGLQRTRLRLWRW
jgi:DNA-binding IscR family transcriptional regulator